MYGHDVKKLLNCHNIAISSYKSRSRNKETKTIDLVYRFDERNLAIMRLILTRPSFLSSYSNICRISVQFPWPYLLDSSTTNRMLREVFGNPSMLRHRTMRKESLRDKRRFVLDTVIQPIDKHV